MPVVAAITFDPLAIATSSALVFWGLFIGLWIGARLARRKLAEEPLPKEPDAGISGASEVAKGAGTGNAEGTLREELAAGRELVARQAEEIERLRERGTELRARDEAGRREAWEISGTAEANSCPDVPSRWGLACGRARLTVGRLAEAARAEQEQRASGLAQFERLETRLREETERLELGAKSIATARADMEKRKDSGPGSGSGEELADKLGKVEEQLRVLQQNIAGCVSRAKKAHEHLQADVDGLRNATTPLEELEERLAGSDEFTIGEALKNAEVQLEKVKTGFEESRGDGDVDREIEEIVGRIDWAVRESPRGFLEAVHRLSEGAAPSEEIPNDVWERLGQLRGALAGMEILLENPSIRVPIVGEGRSRLAEAVEAAIEGVKSAREIAAHHDSVEDPRGAETEAATPVGDAASSSRDASLSDEVQALRFSNAARDGEIAKLKRALAASEAETETLRIRLGETLAEKANPEPEGAASPAGGINPVAARLAPVPTRRPVSENGVAGPRSSRQFIRRLLGLGGAQARLLSTSSVKAGRQEHAVPVPSASFAEARAALTQLRHRATDETGPAGSAGGNGNALPEESSAEKEVMALRESLVESGRRIAALEAEVAALRHASAREAEGARSSEPEESGDLEIPPVIGSTAAGVPPAASAMAVATVPENWRIGPGEGVPVTGEEVILFRGRDPKLWNRRTETENLDAPEGEELAGFSRPLEDVDAGIGFVRIRRLDTGDSVVASITREALLSGGSAKAKCGWSGRGEQYFGACHLGIFDEALPREVETKFGAGGWGFGHRESIGSGQAYAWAGRAIEDPGEGFEISVGPLPEGAVIEPFPSSQTGERSAVEKRTSPSGDPGPLPITAATVAAAIARSSSFLENCEDPQGASSPMPSSEEPPAEEASVPDLAALARQADDRSGGLVIFRANDPSIWGKETFSGTNRRARSLERLPGGLSYLRLRRIDSGEGVVIPIDDKALVDDADGQPRGFNGTNECFYGAHHLGVFDESLPQEVETRFTYGGWGFGHSVLGPEQQSCGWEGRPIAPDTVFEIAVFRRMPVLGDRDRMIEF